MGGLFKSDKIKEKQELKMDEMRRDGRNLSAQSHSSASFIASLKLNIWDFKGIGGVVFLCLRILFDNVAADICLTPSPVNIQQLVAP